MFLVQLLGPLFESQVVDEGIGYNVERVQAYLRDQLEFAEGEFAAWF